MTYMAERVCRPPMAADQWYGIDCCPEAQPFLDGPLCTGHSGTPAVQLDDPSLRFPIGCASGNVTGTEEDYARCVIVRINLGR